MELPPIHHYHEIYKKIIFHDPSTKHAQKHDITPQNIAYIPSTGP